jgi:hypothetical protein
MRVIRIAFVGGDLIGWRRCGPVALRCEVRDQGVAAGASCSLRGHFLGGLPCRATAAGRHLLAALAVCDAHDLAVAASNHGKGERRAPRPTTALVPQRGTPVSRQGGLPPPPPPSQSLPRPCPFPQLNPACVRVCACPWCGVGLTTQNKNQYDTDVCTWSPQGRLFQVEYAMEAVKQGSASVGLVSDTFAILASLRRCAQGMG